MKKEMLINVLQPEECRIAIVEDGVLEELYVERTSHESYTGNIYKGKVVNLEPAIQAAFVDFSVGRNGFLHVSDVEPQYYYRHQRASGGDEPEPAAREGRRERPPRESRREREPRRDRDRDEREPGAGPPPSPPRAEDHMRERERERDRDRDSDRDRDRPDRPDRSEKGRRDRSEPRRFGEGLVDEERTPSPPPSRASEPPRVEAEAPAPAEPRTSRIEPPPPFPWVEAGPPISPPREPRSSEIDEPRGRINRAPEPFDPDLPPSRTQRSRFQPSPPPSSAEPEERARSREFGEIEEPWSSAPPPPSSRPEREPRRPRGRGRGRPSPESALPFDIEPPAPLEQDASEPRIEERPEPPRRRGGRAAIRSRGGDREAEPRRPAPTPPPPPPASAFGTPGFEGPADEGFESEAEGERYRSPEPERPYPRAREGERSRGPEGDRPTSRKLHDRAGEPGYVPRRERSRSPFGPEPATPFDWSDIAPEPAPGFEVEGSAEESSAAHGRLEGPRRRKRRRGRRRGEREPRERESSSSIDSFGAELEERETQELPRTGREPSRRGVPAEVPDLIDEFDFGEEPEDADDLDEADEGELGVSPVARVPASIEEEIDPELEEEIRKEIEEIAELEREIGLRGTTEARPRRGDDAEGGRQAPGRFSRGRGMVKPPIQEIFKRGDEVLVQVIKESIGTKGPTLSTYISIPGRYLVLMPGLNRVGVSRKIADEGQRRKLREIMNELNPPKGLGFIVRTAGLERTKRELARDLAYLLRLWKVILRRIKKSKTPSPIYQESDMITRTIRDIFTSEIDTIWIDEPSAFERAQEFLRVVMPRFVNRLKLYEEKAPLFHKYGIEDEISKIQRRHVPLPEGGSIVIDQTEALVAIDVNSGNFRVENDAERTAYEMNLRAAKEIARQLRLRDLGGVIVNDFIDMRDERHRRGVEKALRDAIKRDRARTKVLRMSQFGLIEMTRQRIRPSLKRSVYEDCPHCTGAGVVKTVESMSIDVMRLLALASHREDIRRVNISVSHGVATYLNNRKRREITRIETDANMTIHIRPEENCPAEKLQIDCFDGNNSEVRLVAAPPSPSGRRGHGHRSAD